MKGKIGTVIKLISVIAVVVICIIVAVLVFRNSDSEPSEKTQIVDMNSDAETEYGKIYYSPSDEEYIDENGAVRYVSNEILITAKEGTKREDVVKLAEKYDCEIVGEIEITCDYQLRFASEMNFNRISELVKRFEAEAIVDSAMLNYVQEISDAAADSLGDFYYGKKWKNSLKDSADRKGKSWGIEAIDTLGAWQQLSDATRQINPVKVGLIDSGFDINHEDLDFAEVFYDQGANGVTTGQVAHGTHVAGTMAADTSDETGISGVYPYGNGRLYGAGLNTNNGAAVYNVYAMAMKICLAELIVRNVKVINVSQGHNWHKYDGFSEWYMEDSEDNDNFRHNEAAGEFIGEFLQRMLDKGYDFVIAVAAGNDSSDLPSVFDAKKSYYFNAISRDDYPEVYDRIIVVGAVDYKLEIASYSNGGTRVDIYAPGGEFALGNKRVYSCLGDDKYGYMSGTSMATPHVAGVAAMVWSANNSLNGDQVKDIICSSVSTRCTSCDMVDASLAVRSALNMTDTGNSSNAYNCGMMCYVVDREDTGIPVEGATVTAVNVSTRVKYTETTDVLGHFELMVPAGTYTLTVEADGYEDYTWPGNNTNLSNTITVRNQQIKYLDDWIKMIRDDTYEAPDDNALEDFTADVQNNSDNEFLDYLEDYGLPLQDVVVWKEYNGHLYVLYDYAVSATTINYITKINPEVHLVTITGEDEQEVVEELAAQGGRDVYYTGGKVDRKGNVYWVTGENAKYTNWCDGGPVDYQEEGYDDIVVVYRGYETYAEDDSDFGKWFEILENQYSFFDIFDSDIEGVTRGIIVEFDKY